MPNHTDMPIVYLTPRGGQWPDELQPRIMESGSLLNKLHDITTKNILVVDLRETEVLVNYQTLFGIRPRAIIKVPGVIYPPSWLHVVSALPMVTLETIDGEQDGTTAEIEPAEASQVIE